MKKIFFISIVLLFISCTKDQKCKSLIKDYLSKNLDDYSSYEPVEFSKIIFDSTTYYESDIYKYYGLKANAFEVTLGLKEPDLKTDELMYVRDTATLDGEKKINYNDSLSYYMKKQNDFAASFKRKHIGWEMAYKFRVNINGNSKLFVGFFKISMDYSKIELAEINPITQ